MDLIERFSQADVLTKAAASVLSVGVLPLAKWARRKFRQRRESIAARDGQATQVIELLTQILGAGPDDFAGTLKRLETKADAQRGEIEKLSGEVHTLAGAVHGLKRDVDRAHAMTNALLAMSDRAYWISHADGSWKTASPRLARMLEVVPEDLLGWGWVGSIAIEDRETVRLEWLRACDQVRQWHQRYEVRLPAGRRLRVEGNSFPVLAADGEEIIAHIGWLAPESPQQRSTDR